MLRFAVGLTANGARGPDLSRETEK